MRALITGAGGQLGRALAARLPDGVALDRAALPLGDGGALRRALDAGDFEVVFNCAAFNGVDAAESEPGATAARETNARVPGELAAACRERGIQLVHFSTNFVFDGAAGRPYLESDAPNPLSAYGRSKRAGEEAVLRELPSALVIRTAGVFGTGGSAVKGGSFPERIVAAARRGAPLRVVGDQLLNPTYAGHLAEAALRLAGDGSAGVRHVVADGCCSWFELATAVLEEAGIEAPIERVTTASLGSAAARPLNGCLGSEFVAPLAGWREGVREFWRSVRDAGSPGPD